MGTLGASVKYLYWSERRIARLEEDNSLNARLRKSVTVESPSLPGTPKVSGEFDQRPPTRKERAARIEAALGEELVRSFNTPDCRFAAGSGSIIFSQFENVPENDRTVIFSKVQGADGSLIGIALFGSMSNYIEFLQNAQAPLQHGWTSSAAPSVFRFLQNRQSGTSWDNSPEYLAREAIKIADGQGIAGDANRPATWSPTNRGFTFGDVQNDAEWAAEIYLDYHFTAEQRPIEGEYDRVLIGAPLWVRTPYIGSLRVFDELERLGEARRGLEQRVWWRRIWAAWQLRSR